MKAINKYNPVIWLTLILMISAACSESFLDYDQRGAQTASSFYKTDAQALEGLMAVFDQWQQGAAYTYMLLNFCLSDDSYAGGGARNDVVSFEEMNEYRFNASTEQLYYHYGWLYNCINRSNLLINNVDITESDTANNKVIYVAMAKALRAYAYFFLVNLWGDIPLVINELSASEYAQARTPKAEVYAQIEKDLTEAVKDLPVRSELVLLGLDHLISKGTAQAILGKTYLFEKKYDEAAAVFQQIIDSEEYGLYPDYSRILRQESEYGVECVWDIAYVTTMGYYFSTDYTYEASLGGMVNYLAPRPACLGSEYDASNHVYSTLGITTYGWGFFGPHKELYDAFTNAGDKVRRNTTIISPDSLQQLGHKYITQAGYLPYGSDGYLNLKYLPYLSEGEGDDVIAKYGNIGTNFRMIRYADVLLMAAEAYNRKSNPDDGRALEYINLVRNRVELTPLTSVGDQLFSDIKLERRLEFAYEGLRYLDLQRWGDAYETLKDQGKSIPNGSGGYLSIPDAGYKKNKNELLPIPEYEMLVNPKMTQNPGY